jgi:hypothetical protein
VTSCPPNLGAQLFNLVVEKEQVILSVGVASSRDKRWQHGATALFAAGKPLPLGKSLFL